MKIGDIFSAARRSNLTDTRMHLRALNGKPMSYEHHVYPNGMDSSEPVYAKYKDGELDETQFSGSFFYELKRQRELSERASKFNLNPDEFKRFSPLLLDEIIAGLEAGVDVSWYAAPGFYKQQMQEIRLALEEGFDVSWFADPRIRDEQMKVIRWGLEKGFDASALAALATPGLDEYQILKIKDALREGLDPSPLATPIDDYSEIDRIYRRLKKLDKEEREER